MRPLRLAYEGRSGSPKRSVPAHPAFSGKDLRMLRICPSKLFLKAEPGAILANDSLVNLVRGWPVLTEKTVRGVHFVQEDSPDEIGRAIAGWVLRGCHRNWTRLSRYTSSRTSDLAAVRLGSSGIDLAETWRSCGYDCRMKRRLGLRASPRQIQHPSG